MNQCGEFGDKVVKPPPNKANRFSKLSKIEMLSLFSIKGIYVPAVRLGHFSL